MTQATLPVIPIELLNNLHDPDYKIRRQAAVSLSLNYPSQALSPLCALLRDQHSAVRSRACKELGKLKNKGALGPLIQALSDTSQRVQTQAFKALGKLKDAAAVGPITSYLHDSAPAVQLAALKALSALRDPVAVPVLLTLLSQSDEPVQALVVQALGVLKDRRAVPALLALSKQSLSQSTLFYLLGALGSIGDEAAIDRLLEFIDAWSAQQVEPMVASQAIWALASIGGNRALRELLALYHETQDTHIHLWIYRSFVRIKHIDGELKAEATELLLQALTGSESCVVPYAVQALEVSFKDERAIRPLLALLSTKNYYLFYPLTKTLNKLSSPRLLAEILALYHSTNDTNIRYHLIFILKNVRKVKCIEWEQTFDLLLQLLDEQQELRILLQVIAALGGPFKNEQAVKPLLALLSSGNAGIVRSTITALGNIADTRAVEPLLSLLGQRGYVHCVIPALSRFKERRVVERLIALLDPRLARRVDYQYILIHTLGRIGDPLAIEPLKAFENCGNPYYRDLARKVVIKLEQ